MACGITIIVVLVEQAVGGHASSGCDHKCAAHFIQNLGAFRLFIFLSHSSLRDVLYMDTLFSLLFVLVIFFTQQLNFIVSKQRLQAPVQLHQRPSSTFSKPSFDRQFHYFISEANVPALHMKLSTSQPDTTIRSRSILTYSAEYPIVPI